MKKVFITKEKREKAVLAAKKRENEVKSLESAAFWS